MCRRHLTDSLVKRGSRKQSSERVSSSMASLTQWLKLELNASFEVKNLRLKVWNLKQHQSTKRLRHAAVWAVWVAWTPLGTFTWADDAVSFMWAGLHFLDCNVLHVQKDYSVHSDGISVDLRRDFWPKVWYLLCISANIGGHKEVSGIEHHQLMCFTGFQEVQPSKRWTDK